jgi:hypothetical protein
MMDSYIYTAHIGNYQYSHGRHSHKALQSYMFDGHAVDLMSFMF